jgi:hypothetical protein
MPFDSNGVFSRVMNWTSDQQNGIAIECGRHDAEDNNFAEGFNETFCRDGRAAATGNFNLGNHKIQNLAEGIAATDAVTKGQLDASSAAGVSLNTDQTITGQKTFTVSPNVPTPATSDNSTKAATTAYVKNQGYALDNTVVHLSGTETITGQKIFTDDVVAKINYSRGTAPASSAYPKPYLIYDTNNKMFGCIQLAYFQNQAVRMELLAYNGANASDDTPASMGVVNNNGNKYTFAPTPTEDTTNSTQIDTVGARNTKLANYVGLTGNQSIAGTKTFTTDIIETINGKRTVAPSTGAIYRGIGIHDTDNTMFMSFLGSVDTSNNASAFMRVFNPTNTSTSAANSAYMTLHYDADGSKYATCPESDKAGSILTTKAKSKAANGYFKLGNGLIIQWGNFETPSGGTQTEQMPTAFSNTNYRLAFTCIGTTPHDSMPTITTKTTNTFTFKRESWSGTTSMDWIAIGY